MKKLLRTLKNQRGVTLTELIAGMVIMTIITIAVSSILVPLLKIFSAANELAEVNTLLDTLAEEILNDCSRAVAISANGSTIEITTGSKDITYSVNNGILMRDDEPVLANEYYKGKTIGIDTGSPGVVANKFEIELTVSSADGEIGKRTYAVNPLFLYVNK